MGLVHLHAHSTFSFLDGFGTPSQISSRILELGHTASAITDHGNVFAHVPYQKEFRKRGLKPIFGCEFYVTDNMRERTSAVSQKRGSGSYPHVTILASTQKGYHNLLKLSRLSYEEGFYYKPRLDWEEIARHQEGLVVLSGCVGVYPAGFCRLDQEDDCLEFLRLQKERIQNFIVEIVPEPHLEWTRSINATLIEQARELALPLVLTSDAHFPKPEDHKAQDLMLCVGLGKKLNDSERTLRLPEYQYYCTEQELIERAVLINPEVDRSLWEYAIDVTQRISDACEVEIPTATPVSFYLSESKHDSEQKLFDLWYRALCDKYHKRLILQDDWDTYYLRLHHEWTVLCSKGFADYMLIIIDLVRHIKEKGHLVMCRGSAGGSLLLWVSGCSFTDPLRFGLSFERFYDENRPDPPDVDLDFEPRVRQAAVDYIISRYGEDCCSNIAALSTLKARSALQDACFALGIPRSEYAPLSNLLDSKDEDVMDPSWITGNSEALQLLTKYPQLKIISQMIGQYRQSSVHAAGLLISSEPLDNVIGVIKMPEKVAVASVDKYGAADLGFLKMDFLCVDSLEVVSSALKSIGISLDTLERVDLNDPKVLEVASKGLLAGIFQLDGASAQRVVHEIKVDSFNDLVAASALCRPGPGDWVGTYVRHKNDSKLFSDYLETLQPIAADIVKETFGILLYQEQVMRLARELAGFEWKDVHKLRKMVAGSAGAQLDIAYKEAFILGCLANDVNRTESEFWWASIVTHGGYSFNKSHCVSYGILCYWTLWLKAYHPDAFYESFLALEGSASTPNRLLMKRLLREFTDSGGRLITLDPISSKNSFSLKEPGVLVGGYSNIVGIGPKTTIMIQKKGPYKDWEALQEVVSASVKEKLNMLKNDDVEPKDLLQLAPWAMIEKTPDRLLLQLAQYGISRLGELYTGIKSSGDTYIGGYVVFKDFQADKLTFMLEDETGQVIVRASAAQLRSVESMIRPLEIGDYVAAKGWWQGSVLYVKAVVLMEKAKPEKEAKVKKGTKSLDE